MLIAALIAANILLVSSAIGQSYVGHPGKYIKMAFEDKYVILEHDQSIRVSGENINIEFQLDEDGICHTAIYKSVCNCLDKWKESVKGMGFIQIDSNQFISKRPVYEEARIWKNGGETVVVYSYLDGGKEEYKNLKRLYVRANE